MASKSAPARRSRRDRKSSTRYNDQVNWEDAVQILRAESNSPDRSSDSATPEAVEKTLDPDADINMLADAQQADDDEGEGSLSDSSGIATPEDDSHSNARRKSISRTYSPAIYKKKTVPRPKLKSDAAENGSRNRMFTEDVKISRWSKTKAWTENFGSELEDLYPIIQIRDVWHGAARDSVLPSRRSTKTAMESNARGRYLTGCSSTTSTLNATDEQTSTSVENGNVSQLYEQGMQKLSEEELVEYGYLDVPVRNSVVLGPFDKGTKFILHPGCPLNVLQTTIGHEEAAEEDDDEQSRNEDLEHIQYQAHDQSQIDQKTNRSGRWLINVGATPVCMIWAPGMENNQYLAVCFKCTKEQRNHAGPNLSDFAPAFARTPSYPSNIQIWCVSGEGRDADPGLLSSTTPAQLSLKIATNWGNNIRIEWLPLSDKSASYVRSMAILSSDGHMRIIDIDLSKEGTYSIKQPKFVASPPEHTIFTAFALPSQDDLIVGGADGILYLYNTGTSGSTTPYTTIQLHNTYIMALSIASDYPYLLASSSASGDTQLTDLRAPGQDKIRTHRARLPTSNFSYSPLLHTFFSTSDASGNSEPHGTSLSTLIAFNIRHFHKTSTILKLPELQGIATAMSLSPFHPFILTANAAGQVYCANVLRRLLPTILRDNEPLGWMVKLFEIDWIEQPAANISTSTQDQMGVDDDISDDDRPSLLFDEETGKAIDAHDVFHGRDARPGVTRLYDNFRPVPVELATFGLEAMNPRASGNNKATRKTNGITSAASHQCTYHEEQAVTTMAWNPNPRFSTWAAIGWASGIICITDLGHGMA